VNTAAMPLAIGADKVGWLARVFFRARL